MIDKTFKSAAAGGEIPRSPITAAAGRGAVEGLSFCMSTLDEAPLSSSAALDDAIRWVMNAVKHSPARFPAG